MDSNGTALRESYILGSYITPIGATSNASGIICATGLLMSCDEQSLSWYAAREWCLSYGDGWLYPSVNQLKTIYVNKGEINAILSKTGVTLEGWYWSNQDVSYRNDIAFAVSLSSGESQGNFIKENTFKVRAVRTI